MSMSDALPTTARATLESAIRSTLNGRNWNPNSSGNDMFVVKDIAKSSGEAEQKARELMLQRIAADFRDQHKLDTPPDMLFSLKGSTMWLHFRDKSTYQSFRRYMGVAPQHSVDSSDSTIEERVAADRIARNGENIRG